MEARSLSKLASARLSRLRLIARAAALCFWAAAGRLLRYEYKIAGDYSMGAHAWTFISILKERQYGGNRGYDDDPKRVYRYDSSVPNHLKVSRGDLVFVRDRDSVIGMARIDRIVSGPATKTRLRCPTCDSTGIKERRNLRPRWRCTNGHLFETPSEELVDVAAYEAHYKSNFIGMSDALTVADLKRAAPRPSDQLSIEEVDVIPLVDRINSAGPQARDLLAQYLQATGPEIADLATRGEDGGVTSYVPSIADTRRRINCSIALRRGQQSFRNGLIRRYGAFCMVTGCKLLEIVEAAHIWPYRGDSDNNPENGILLRADLHTLFDLDLIGIEPEELCVSVHPFAKAVGYQMIEGVRLLATGRNKPSREALAARWASFLERQAGQ